MWRKATRSEQTGQCVELAALETGIGVRDSKSPDGPKLVLDRSSFHSLVLEIRTGDPEK
ncbi:DUF397 domain-containing protein [Actinomadura rupiterrae]|uniref:DUF397 domain-containing protein n=1 Tax=Actinomadura rupiterrae TaxID=559627 RepID=UPI0027E3731B|nr:DUF397 domain-containing protein [Actinomadura rupiterrae]MCP2342048.1 hypothetical protein [Actinomadura rupiterrae]